MSVATIKLSSKGQVVIPKEIRDELDWEAGTQLSLVATGGGVALRAMPTKTGRSLDDLIGLLKHEGDPISIDTLCRPVDIGAEWESLRRSK
jgi:AbrB family looped-hinge helix DNA binding protein